VKRTPLKRRTALSPRRLEANRAAGRAAAAAAHARRVGVVCKTCSTEFFVPPSKGLTRKFCSQACMGVHQRKKRERTCAVCGSVFAFATTSLRKTCSVACSRELISRSKRGRKNPAWTGRQHSSDPRWKAAIDTNCAVCDSTRRLQRHHVVYEQHVRRRGGDCFHPDDCLTVCFTCHVAHHRGRGGRIKVSQLRRENLAFARDLLGEYARDYFVRYYDLDCDVLGAPDPMITEWMPEGDEPVPTIHRGERRRRRSEKATTEPQAVAA
jgi:hypothetical protein